MSLWVITRLTFREASRRWILWAALLLGLAFLTVYGIGFSELHRDMEKSSYSTPIIQNQAYNFLMMAGLYVVNFLTVMMSVLTSVDAISGEIGSGTIQTLLSKPVRRWEVLLGKWLGFEIMLTLYLLLMAGGVLAIGRLIGGYSPSGVLVALVLMWLNTVILLSVTFVGGTLFSTLANGVLAFGLYGIAFLGSWIEQFGTFFNNQVAMNIGILCSLVIPSEAVWRRAANEMQSALVSVMEGAGATPFTLGAVPSDFMIGYAILYALVCLGLAVRNFSRRDM